MISLTNIKPLVKVALALVIIIVLIIITSLISGKFQRNGSISYKPSLPPTTKPVPLTQPAGFQSELSKVLPFLPYKTGNFSIEYQKEVNILSIKIAATSKDSYRSSKKEAEDFLKSKNISNVCALNIFWVPQIKDPSIRKSLETQDYYAATCLPPSPKK